MLPAREASADERAVTPVVGIVLIVAVAIVLAAIVGPFAFNLAQEDVDKTPQASLTFEDAEGPNADYASDPTPDAFVIKHDAGDRLKSADIKVIIKSSKSRQPIDSYRGGSWSNGKFKAITVEGSTWAGGDFYTAGDRMVIAEDSTKDLTAGQDYYIQIVHPPSGGFIANATVELE